MGLIAITAKGRAAEICMDTRTKEGCRVSGHGESFGQ